MSTHQHLNLVVTMPAFWGGPWYDPDCNCLLFSQSHFAVPGLYLQ